MDTTTEQETPHTGMKALLDAGCEEAVAESETKAVTNDNQQTEDTNNSDNTSKEDLKASLESETADNQEPKKYEKEDRSEEVLEEGQVLASLEDAPGSNNLPPTTVSNKKTEDKKPPAVEKKPSSFAKLVKTWETYISDAHRAENFQPMQMLQNLRLCGTGHDVGRLTLAPSTEFTNQVDGQDPFEPIILRHTHSTPLQYRPSFLNDYDNGVIPPPSQLDPTRRSSSTPSRGSAFQTFNGRSAFGRHLHSTSNISSGGNVSAFGFPLHRSSFSGVSTESNIRSSAFDPVPFVPSTSTVQEEPQQENTSIEVMDLGPETSYDVEEREVEVEIADGSTTEQQATEQTRPKKSAAARAARFLSDVGVLRRKKKGARGSLVTSTSSVDSSSTIKMQDTSDIASKNDDIKESATEDEMAASDNTEIVLNQSAGSESDTSNDSGKESAAPYQQFDSDVEEECDRYHCIESGKSVDNSLNETSKNLASSGYQPIEDEHPAVKTSWEQSEDQPSREPSRHAVRIQVSCNAPSLPQITEQESFHITDTSSPRHFELADGETTGNASPNSGSNSPGTSGSSATISTSGHTTQATSTTSVSGNNSRISETDREVMEAIKEGKRRRRQETRPENDKNDSVHTVDSSSTTSTPTNGYMALSGSPGLRDGASVVADRFFTHSRTPEPPSNNNQALGMTSFPFAFPNLYRSQTSSNFRKNMNSGSPTSTSMNSTDEKPPKFVSYLDRQAASDLTSIRGTVEASSCRAEVEEREDSPAEIVGYPGVIFEEAKGEDDQENENSMSVLPKLVLPTKERLYSMLDRFRSRPPRSPATPGAGVWAPTTPPPRLASPAYHHQVSPPRNIIDHRMDSNLSRPYVIRTNPSTQKLVLVSPGSSSVRPASPLMCVPVGSPNYSPNLNRPLSPWQEQVNPYENILKSRTYEERSIEILKTESKEEMLCQRFASPSPENGSCAL